MAGMPVAVDEAGHQHLATRVDHLARLEPCPDLLRGPHGDNPVADALDAVLPLAPALARDFADLWAALEAFAAAERERLLVEERGPGP